MITTETLIKTMASLSTKRKLFWSEADFQFSLAQELRGLVPVEAQIYLERPIANIMEAMQEENKTNNRKKCYIDIWIQYDGKVYPIELKYATKAAVVEDFDRQQVMTVNQYAYDITRFGYLYDIHRIERIKKCLVNTEGLEFGRGFAIILTNDANYYNAPEDIPRIAKTRDANFRIHQNNTPPKEVKWNYVGESDEQHWTKTKHPYNKSFKLPITLNFDWRQYGNEKGVKYLINVVN